MNPMRRTPRKGFTLIELLVVIGILLLLVGLAVFGLSKVINTQKRAATKITLENLRGMLTEYEMVAKGLGPKRMWTPNGSTAVGDVWNDANPLTPLKDPLAAPLGTVAREANTGGTPAQTPRYSSVPIFNTQLVLEQLLTAPNNKKVQTQFPSSQLLEKLPPGLNGCFLLVANGLPYTGTSEAANPPLVLDAWGNPILFVPSSGMFNVVEGDGDMVHIAVPVNPNDTNGPVRSPDRRPFWVSAGPDGVFGFVDVNGNGSFTKGTDRAGGDDNMYSFEN